MKTTSSYHPKNLSKDEIDRRAKMFLFLNTCPTKKDSLKTFFRRVFKKYRFETTNSGIILYTMNAMKLRHSDERNVISEILQKVAKYFKLKYIHSEKKDEIQISDITNIGKMLLLVMYYYIVLYLILSYISFGSDRSLKILIELELLGALRPSS